MSDKVLYFAYGSNMNPERMKNRRVDFVKRQRAILYGFRLEFNKRSSLHPKEGFANIVPAQGKNIEGVLYEIAASDLPRLDEVEGYPVDYNRIKLQVEIAGRRCVEAEVYIAQPDHIANGLRPTKDYINHLLAAKGVVSDSYYMGIKKVRTID